MQSMRALLDPKANRGRRRVAAGRGTRVIANLRDAGFKGDIFAVNPRYHRCVRLHVLRQRRRPAGGGRLPRGRGRRRERVRRAWSGAGARNSRCGGAVGGIRRGRGSSALRAPACAPSPTRAWRSADRTASASSTSDPARRRSQRRRRRRRWRGQSRWSRRAAASAISRSVRWCATASSDFSLFHLVRQPDRHDGRGLCRAFRRRSRRLGDRRVVEALKNPRKLSGRPPGAYARKNRWCSSRSAPRRRAR